MLLVKEVASPLLYDCQSDPTLEVELMHSLPLADGGDELSEAGEDEAFGWFFEAGRCKLSGRHRRG